MKGDTSVTETQTAGLTHRPELEGRVAVVTGAANGMGGEICNALAADGAMLMMVGRDTDALDRHAARLRQRFGTECARTQRCDVTNEDDVNAVVATATETMGGVDVLVNSAGVIGPIETPAQNVALEDFRHIIDVNLIGTFLACKAAIPSMIERGWGRIVNIAGTSGLRGYRNRVGYSSSKWAVRGLTHTLALELGRHGITVNAVCPNVTNGRRMETIVRVKAERLGKSFDEVYADFAGQTALGRFIDEIDVAEAVRYLVSNRARNVTGQDLVVDAGWAA